MVPTIAETTPAVAVTRDVTRALLSQEGGGVSALISSSPIDGTGSMGHEQRIQDSHTPP